MDRWRSLSVLLFGKKKKTKQKKDIEIITSCCNFFKLQDSNATSNLCWTLYTCSSSIQDQNVFFFFFFSFQMIAIEKSSPVLFFFILWALFCTCIQMPFYMGCCIYILGQAFLTWSLLCLCVYFSYTWSSPVFSFFLRYFFLRQYVCVCHISFSGEGLEF